MNAYSSMNTCVSRTVVIAALFIATTASTFAQSTYKMGIVAGANASSLSSDLFTTASGRLGYAAGCSFVISLNDKFEYNQEIVFTQKGGSAKTVQFRPEEQPLNGTNDFHYNTFEAGSFIGFKPVESLPFQIHAGAFVGSHFANLDRTKRDQYLGNYEDLNEATRAVDLNDAFSGVDFGPAIGISAGEKRFRANVRYYLGARNLYNNIAFTTEDHQIRTKSLRFSLTYFFKA